MTMNIKAIAIVLYRNVNTRCYDVCVIFKVHVRTISCGSGSCVCGIVIREGSVMYEVYRCNPDPRAYDYGLYFPWGQSAELNAQAAVGWSHAMHTSGNEFTVSYSITIVRSDGRDVSALPSRVLEDSLTMCSSTKRLLSKLMHNMFSHPIVLI